MATAPSTAGLGSVKGAVTDRLLPSSVVMVAIGPVPPPERVSPVVATLGLRVPSVLACRLGSRSAHEPVRFVRTASALSVVVRVPSGLATDREVSLVRLGTGVGLPVDFALATASSTACCAGVRAGAGEVGTSGPAPPVGPWEIGGGAGVTPAADAGGAASRAAPRTRPAPAEPYRTICARIDGRFGAFANGSEMADIRLW